MKTKKTFLRVFLFLSLISLFPLQSIAYAADLTGTAVISGTAIYGQQLTASVQDGESNTGPYQYQWMRDETPVGTPSATATYSIAEADIGHYIYVIVTSLGDTGSLTSAQTATVEKADCETDPIEAPVLDPAIDITDTTVTLTNVTGYEYIIVADDATELPEVDWQDSEEFTGLTPNTAYDAYQRVKETATHKASAASVKLDVSTVYSVLSGTVTISGTAVFGQTLTATETTNNSGDISYQWLRGASPIASATLSTYELVLADIGQQISVEITSSHETGSLTSDATAVVQKAASSPTKGITPVLDTATDTTITVTAVTGYEYLIAADGTAVLPDTWQDSNVFTGLTASTPYDIYQRVKATDTHNASETSDRLDASTAAEALTGTVTISGSAVFGQTLTATPSTNSTGTISYQWMRDDIDIASATGSTYELVEADVGTQISVKITSSDKTGTLTSAATAAVDKADCTVTPIVTPVLSSKTASSITVTTVAGYEYKIVADGADSSGGTWQSTNVFSGLSSNTAYDIYQRVKETTTHKASDISGRLDVTTEVGTLTGTAQITGTLKYGQQLTASLSGSNNTGTLSYQWMREGANISSATGDKYTLGLSDIGQKMSVKITSSVETGTITSAQTAAVEKADNPVLVVETPELQSKTSSTITLVSKEFYEYMIVANDASSSTGTWQSSNVFSGLSAGTQYDFYERVAGTATQNPSAISAKLDVTTDGVTLTGTASISGTATYGKTLTASLSSTNNTGTLSYQWVRGTSDIPSATSSTYVLSASDVGQKIRVKISSSVEAGTVTSAQTSTVQKAESSVSKGILPVLSDRSRHTVTVTARTGYEYMIVRSGYSYTTGTWQTGNVFTDLTSDTAYDVYQRVKETSTRKASAVSDKLDVNTRAYSSSSSSTATPTPTPKPSASATPTPTITLAPTPSPTIAPTATATPVKTTVTPAKINEDKAAGTVTVEIKVSDLPQGTKSIRTSDDKVITVSGTDTVYVTVNKTDINEDGTIELVTLDDEGVALGYMAIDASQVNDVPEKSGGGSALLWIIIGLGAILVFTAVIYIIGRIRMRGRHGY